MKLQLQDEEVLLLKEIYLEKPLPEFSRKHQLTDKEYSKLINSLKEKELIQKKIIFEYKTEPKIKGIMSLTATDPQNLELTNKGREYIKEILSFENNSYSLDRND